jgi:hypothetical protein
VDVPGAGPSPPPPGFELTVSVSQDARLAAAVRDVARQAAQAAGYDPAAAETFGRQVEDALRRSMLDGPATPLLPVTFRCRNRAVEVDVDGRTLTLDV